MLAITHQKLVRIVLPILIIIISISCKTDKQKNGIIDETKASITSFVPKTEKEYQSIIDNFIECKSNATQRSHCRNEITKVISEAYGLSEFKNENQKYVIYDSIQPIIKRSKHWKNIGAATNQETLNKALDYTNNDGLSLIIDTSNSYGHIVMLLPGKNQYSGSWSMNLPHVLSLLNSSAEKSFRDKSLSFAFKKSDDLHVFTRQ